MPNLHKEQDRVAPQGGAPPTPWLHTINSPFYKDVERNDSTNYFRSESRGQSTAGKCGEDCNVQSPTRPQIKRYTSELKERPTRTFIQQLKLANGRLHDDNWFCVAIRPFILFAYPAVLWSSVVYACSVGWLIVLSESVAHLFRDRTAYGFSALSTGLIYISPFIGGILGTAVAGKVSDIIVKAMSRRNGGLYEPEFRLLMALPVAITTVIGLMGFGWSAQIHDHWIVPTSKFNYPVISSPCQSCTISIGLVTNTLSLLRHYLFRLLPWFYHCNHFLRRQLPAICRRSTRHAQLQ